MAIQRVGSLVVDLVAESAQYIAGLQRANRETQRWSRQVSRSFSSATKSIAGMAAGYLGLNAVISQTNQAMANAKEIENLSRLANQNVEDFQAASYAVEQYGVSAEKLSDISKDVSDKLGDFIATGGGEFKDFFTNVAPKVGLTADKLKGLAGPDVLIAVKKAMDDANISMEEQIFYLESIANDTTLLLPLLENNGQAYRDLTRDARDANLIMSKADISKLRESEKIITRLSKQMSTAFASAVAGSAEQLNWLATVASGVLRQIGNELDALNDIPNTLEGSIEKIADLQEEINGVSDSITRLEDNTNAYNRDIRLAAERANLNRLKQELKEIQASRWELQAKAKINILEQPKLPDIKPVTGTVIVDTKSDIEPVKKTADDIINTNQRVLDSLTRSLATQKERIQQTFVDQVKIINDLVLTEKQVRAEGYDSLENLQKDYIKKADEHRKAQLERLKTDIKESNTDMVEIVSASTKAMADSVGVSTSTMENATKSWANGFTQQFSDMVTKGKLDFSNLAESIINDLMRMAIQTQITQPLLNAMGLSAPAGKALGGPVMRGSTYLVGETGPELFTASHSGTIIPNNRLNGGNTTVNVYTQPGETAETRARNTNQGDVVEIFMKQIDSRLNEQISRGQGIARTLEGRYSLNRKSF